MITITTHNGTFHADEVTAIALLQVFHENEPIKWERVPHQTTEFTSDFVIDIGRVHNPEERKFDHHQWHSSEDGRSSAGLVWDFLKQPNILGRHTAHYPNIDELIKAVDDNDIGIKPATQIEYSRLLSLYNHQDVHSQQQSVQFQRAIDFAVDIITGMKLQQDAINITKEVIRYAQTVLGADNVLELPEYLQGWGKFVNGEKMPKIHAVIYPDKKLGTWNLQTTQVNTESYDKVGKPFQTTSDIPMNFIHKDGFFAVAKTRSDAVDFLHEWNCEA